MTEAGEAMFGGRFARPVRRGDTVERTPGPGRDNVHALLAHFERQSFTLAPRFLGMTAEGRERLSYIEGDIGYPPYHPAIQSQEALVSVARAIREMHDATQGFVPVRPGAWGGHDVCAPVGIDCIGHFDLAPWNIIFRGTQVAGLIDWDCARPSNRVYDLSYPAYLFVPLQPTDSLAAWGWASEPDRAARLRLFADSYGRSVSPAELVDLAIVRLTSIGAHIARQVRAGDPAFALHAEEKHAEAYLSAAAFVISHRDTLVR